LAKINGTDYNTQWVAASTGTGTVTSVTASAPLTGGTITTSGSIGLDQTALSITNAQVSGLGTASTKDVPATGNASSTQVVYGTDTRLTNSRTPTAHASTHGVAGSDPVAVASSQVSGLATSATTDTTNAANITSGTLPNARLVSVPNSALANSSVTVNGSTISLGGSATVTAAPSGTAGGDLTGTYPSPTLAALSPSPAGTYGSASAVPAITVDTKGRTTSVTSTAIAIASSAVSGLATSATTDTTNASNITSGTLPNARLVSVPDSALATISTAGKVSNSATTATDANTASAIVARDASGNFNAGTITANLSGIASVASSFSGTSINLAYTGPGGYKTTIGGATNANITLNLPGTTGYLVSTGDTGTVSNTMLVNSSVTVNGSAISLGSSATVTAAPSGTAGGDLTGTYPNPTGSTSGNLVLKNNANAFTVGGHTITNASTTVVPLMIKAVTSQTANFLEFQPSGSTTPLTSITSAGAFVSAVGGHTIVSNSAVVPLTLTAQSGGSTNAFEIYDNSATRKFYLNQFGNLFASGSVNFQNGLILNAGSATKIATQILGAASQTADLLQLQNSVATVLGGSNANAQTYTGSTTPILVTVGTAAQATATSSGTTATITTRDGTGTAVAHNLAAGDLVNITGFVPTGYNGTYVILASPAPTTTTFAVTTVASGLAAGSSGTVFTYPQASITTRSVGTKGLVIKGGATGQVANYQEWSNSAGSAVVSIDSNLRLNAGIIALTNLQGSSDGLTAVAFAGSRNIQIGSVTTSVGGGSGVIGITNATTVPTTNPTGGGVVYVDTGKLAYRGTSGTGAVSTASVTAATGAAGTVTYTATNTFVPGQVVTITGLGITSGASLNLTNVTIATATSSLFTVTNATVGVSSGTGTATVSPTGPTIIAADGSNALITNRLLADSSAVTATTFQNIFPAGSSILTLEPSTSYAFRLVGAVNRGSATASTLSVRLTMSSTPTTYRGSEYTLSPTSGATGLHTTNIVTSEAQIDVSVTSGSATTTLRFFYEGMFTTSSTVNQTLTPQWIQSANASSVMQAGTYFQLVKVGTAVGAWA
jgi:hypothetical protein